MQSIHIHPTLMVLSALSASLGSPASAQNRADTAVDCGSITGLEELVDTGRNHNIYLGELHGTTESAALFACLSERLVVQMGGRLIVSVEVPPSARNATAQFWRGRDGRSSVAMADLLQRLAQLEGQGRLEIHFQRRDVGGGLANDHQFVAQELDRLTLRGRVIVLSGNRHARRTMPDAISNLRSAAMELTSQFLLVNIVNIRSGEAWNCQATCGPNQVIAAREALQPGLQNVTGESVNMTGFDMLFALDRFTASPPVVARP